MRATPEAAVLVGACVACCVPLIAGAGALVTPPILLAAGVVVAVRAGLAGFARRRQLVLERDTVGSAEPGTEASNDTPS